MLPSAKGHDMRLLTELQRDALAELLNIGVGSAAASLSEMVGEEVLLSVPSVQLMSRAEAAASIAASAGEQVTAVRESFSGPFWGDALMIIPREHGRELVQALLNEHELPMERLTEMEQEALTEVGNIIINACLSSLSDALGESLFYRLPFFVHGSCQEVLSLQEQETLEGLRVLLLRMDFSLRETRVQGYLTLLMDVEAVQQLVARIEGLASGVG